MNSRHEQEDAIKNAHSGALAFAAALLEAQLPQSLARVDINVDLSIGINGTAQNLNATLKRQLFVLAFLRDRADFSLKEYSALYGNGSGEARKEFDQNNRKISGALGLPKGVKRFWRATPGRRTVDCIEWNVSASQADLAQFLKENARFPEKWSLPDGDVSA